MVQRHFDVPNDIYEKQTPLGAHKAEFHLSQMSPICHTTACIISAVPGVGKPQPQ